MKIFKKLIYLLTAYERKRAGLLLIMIMIMAFLDMIGVASILPFMTVLTNPELIETNIILKNMFEIFDLFGVKNNQEFLFALGILMFVLLIISLSFKALTTYAQTQFIQMSEYNIGKKFVEGYLNQPYSWFLSQNSADLGKTILSEVQEVVGTALSPFIELVSKSIVSAALIIILILADPKIALIVAFSICSIYLFIFYFVSNYLKRIGRERLKNNQKRFSTVNEAFGAAKEIKIGGLEHVYINNFANSAKIFAKTKSYAKLINQLPRYILEATTFGAILLMIIYIISKTGNFNSVIPIVSLYVFAGYRLIPALQTIYASVTLIAFSGPSLNKIYNDLNNLKIIKNYQDLRTHDNNQDKDNKFLFREIALKNIYYNYPNSTRAVLHNISLTIPAKSIIGIIGPTGSGKTTLIDIILALLEPQKGTLEIDGQIITNQNSRLWQRSIGYVPQNIYLSDDTVAANIAFGVETKDIDFEAVKKSARLANIHDFIVNELPEKYYTFVGERGIRLSGGQRQRIGIARALYHNRQVLLLDEATSALDNQTEKEVIDAINNLSKDLTIIVIAHRLNTIKNCNIIYKLEKGRLTSKGSFDEMFEGIKNI